MASRRLAALRELQAESDAAHGLEELYPGCLTQLAAEVADVHIDHIALGVEVQIPHLFQQVGAANDLLWPQQEVLEQLELFGREIEAFPTHAHLVLQAVELHRSVVQQLRPARPAAA